MRRILLLLVSIFILFAPATALADSSGLGCSADMPSSVVTGPQIAPEIEAAVNQHRKARGLAQLKTDLRLTRAATWKSRDLVARGQLYDYSNPHNDPGVNTRPERTPSERALTCGHVYPVGENILASYYSLSGAEIVRSWLASPAHRANIENPSWRYMGTGIAQNPVSLYEGQFQTWYTQLFSTEETTGAAYCSTLTRTIRMGSSINLNNHSCVAGIQAALFGKKPSMGSLNQRAFYKAPKTKTGRVTFTMRWPGTMLRQTVELYILSTRPKAQLQSVKCKRSNCSIVWNINRSQVGTRASIQLQQKIGRSWVARRAIVLPSTSDSGKRTVQFKKGTYRMRATIAGKRGQKAAYSSWRTVRIR